MDVFNGKNGNEKSNGNLYNTIVLFAIFGVETLHADNILVFIFCGKVNSLNQQIAAQKRAMNEYSGWATDELSAANMGIMLMCGKVTNKNLIGRPTAIPNFIIQKKQDKHNRLLCFFCILS